MRVFDANTLSVRYQRVLSKPSGFLVEPLVRVVPDVLQRCGQMFAKKIAQNTSNKETNTYHIILVLDDNMKLRGRTGNRRQANTRRKPANMANKKKKARLITRNRLEGLAGKDLHCRHRRQTQKAEKNEAYRRVVGAKQQ